MVIFLVFFFIFLPLLFNPFFFESYELVKVLVFVGITNLFLTVLSIVNYYGFIYKWDNLWKLLGAWWLVLATSSLVNGQIESLVGQFYRYQGLITLFAGLEVIFLVSILKWNWPTVEKIIGISGIINSLFIMGQYWLYSTGYPVYHFFGRMTANLGNPNFAGGFLALTGPFLKPIWWPLLFGAIILTDSRSAVLAFGVGCLIKTFLIVQNKWRYGLIMFGIILIILAIPFRPKSNFENREVIWPKAVETFFKKPVLGWGVENFSRAFQSTLTNNDFDLKNIRVDKAHNEFLEYAVAGGLLGLISYIGIWIVTIKKIINIKSKEIRNTLISSLAAYFVLANLNVLSIAEYLFFYFIIGISLNKFQNSEKPE